VQHFQLNQRGYFYGYIMPESERVQKALKWISANLEENNQTLPKLIEKAFLIRSITKIQQFLTNFFGKSFYK